MKRDKDQHDCLTELKDRIIAKDVNLLVAKEEFGCNFERLNLKCDRGHDLRLTRHNPKTHNAYSSGAQCNKCRQGALEHFEFFYHCGPCQHDLCRACALIKAKVLQERSKSQLHRCELSFVPPSRGYRCDCGYSRGANNDMTDVKCLSGHIAFHQGYYTQRWQCRPCDFDMCMKCTMKYAYTPIQNIQLKDCAYAYFIMQSSIFVEDNEIHINRFLKKDEAEGYYLKI